MFYSNIVTASSSYLGLLTSTNSSMFITGYFPIWNSSVWCTPAGNLPLMSKQVLVPSKPNPDPSTIKSLICYSVQLFSEQTRQLNLHWTSLLRPVCIVSTLLVKLHFNINHNTRDHFNASVPFFKISCWQNFTHLGDLIKVDKQIKIVSSWQNWGYVLSLV